MDGGTDVEMKFCSNCKRDIASSNYMMHEIHCRRNIVLCKSCNEPVPRSEMDNHIEENHTKVPCELCGLEVEKLDIETHKEQCPKRPQQCCFCELEFPANDLPNHISYCGTRTEQCFKCAQFIMLKDQDKHDETNCSYPQNTNGNSVPNRRTETPEVVELNSFSMQELERMMNRADFGLEGRINNPMGRAGPRRGGAKVQNVERETLGRRGVTQGISSQAKKKSSENRLPKRTMGRNLNQGINDADADVGEDLDHLLALHLAHDLNSGAQHPGDNAETDLLQYLDDIDEEVPSGDTSVNNYFTPGPGNSNLPCEYCEQEVPASQLWQHQETCLLNLTEGPSENCHTTSRSRGRNNEQPHVPSSPSAEPQVVDNLSYAAAQQWFSQPVPADFTTADDVMLPCEFCDALFPIDFLVQHQAVCPANVTQTPRVMSPAVQSTRIPPRNNNIAAGLDSRQALRRQQDPTFRMLDSETEYPNLGDGPQAVASQKNKNGRMSKVSNDKRTSNRRTGQAQGFTASLAQSAEAPARAEGPESSLRQVNKRKNSATRTQEILHDLVTPPPIASYDLLAHLSTKDGGNQKGVKNSKSTRNSESSGDTMSRYGGHKAQQNGRGMAWGGSPQTGVHPKNKPSSSLPGDEGESRMNGNPSYQASFAEPGGRKGRRSRNVPAATVHSDSLDSLGPSLRVGTREPSQRQDGEGRAKKSTRSRHTRD